MSPHIMGAIVGFVVGLMGYLFIRLAAARVESIGVTKEPAKTAHVLRTLALIDLIVFMVAGYFVGPMIASNSAN